MSRCSLGLNHVVQDTRRGKERKQKKGGMKEIGLKGIQKSLNVGEKGLNKANEMKFGGPAVGLALKGLNVAKGMVKEEIEDTTEYDSELSKRPVPPPPPPKKHKVSKWLGHVDSGTNENYFEDTESGRTTWTEPKEGFRKA